MSAEPHGLQSPLQQLESQTSKSSASSVSPMDRASIYSFDSIATNDRLLDKLDLDKLALDKLNLDEDIFGIEYRSSAISKDVIKSDKVKDMPISVPNNIARFPSTIYTKIQRQQGKNDQSFVQFKTIPNSIIYSNTNSSIDSLKADISRQSLLREPVQLIRGVNSFDKDYDEFDFNSGSESLETPKLSLPVTKPQHGRSVSTNNTWLGNSPSIGRSDTTKTKDSGARSISDSVIQSPYKAKDLSPESRISLLVKLRSSGKHREASYQLQIAANPPYNNIRAMYLYALSLKLGQGVKQNDKSSLMWICKCVIASKDPTALHLLSLKFEDLVGLTIKIINQQANQSDPIKLYAYYSALPQQQLAKLITSCKNGSDTMALVYLELGDIFINGNIIKDNVLGMTCLGIAGAMGNFNAMAQLGELWCTKLKYHKKDNYKASAWFRLSELFGLKSIGNSWIYKEKYLH